MRLQNKVALITGAASGIGKATAIGFAKEGAAVCLVDVNVEGGEQAAHEIRSQRGDAIFVKADVSNSAEVKNSVEKAMEKWGRINVLINNAAVTIKKTVVDLEEWEWDKLLDVNLKSMYLYAHLVVPIMIEQGGGVVLNMGSVTSLVAVPEFPGYISSKTGVVGLTRAIAYDHGRQGIRANCICPSGIDTPQMDWLYEQSPDPEAEIKRVLDMHPIGRTAKPHEVTSLLIFLASDEASYITGAICPIDGGYSIW